MNPLLKKEIRLLVPAWILTMLLALAPACIPHLHNNPREAIDNFTPVWFGVLILCASSFGREFSLGTFSSLLAQPFPRKQYWMTKVGVLAAALVSVLAAYGLFAAPNLLTVMGRSETTLLIVLLLTAIGGGLSLALCIRQMMAVIWLIVLVPFLLCLPVLLILSHYEVADRTVEITLDLILLAYAAAAIAGSWLIFRRAQDAPWSGGTIVLPEWMTARVGFPSVAVKARTGSLWALIRKEYHLNQVALLGMGVLFLLELGVIGLRYEHRNPPDVFWRDLNFSLEAFGSVWIMAPLIIGCMSVAEERNLGMMEGQLCQPISRLRLFWVKLGFTLVVGGILSSCLFMLGEGIAQWLGLNAFDHGVVVVAGGGLCAIALIAFFASSLTRNLVQALSAAVCAGAGIAFIMTVFMSFSGFYHVGVHRVLWNPILPECIFIGLLVGVGPWLAYRNMGCVPEFPRIWWRNGFALVTMALFTALVSVAIYNRIWDIFTPFEPAHGPARWTQNDAPTGLRTGLNENNLLFQLPDGRYWYGWLGPWNPGFDDNTGQNKMATAPHLVGTLVFGGSNWVALTTGSVDIHLSPTNTTKSGLPRPLIYERGIGSFETVGIQANGTLWVSAKPSASGWNSLSPEWNTHPLVRFGTETNWQDAATLPDSRVGLLKKDGTLWRWGDPWHRDLLTIAPVQIGTNDDWQQFSAFGWSVKKKDGSVWTLRFNSKTHLAEAPRKLKFDPADLQPPGLDDTKQVSGTGPIQRAGIHPDGTLWISLVVSSSSRASFTDLKVGSETNWVKAGLAFGMGVVALKDDGTLWQWGENSIWNFRHDFDRPPVRLGISHDWIALSQCQDGIVSLAADGSLWLWKNALEMYSDPAHRAWVRPSTRPILLGNIMAAN